MTFATQLISHEPYGQSFLLTQDQEHAYEAKDLLPAKRISLN